MRKPRKLLTVSKTLDTGTDPSDPDNLGDYDAVKKLAFDMKGGSYWHDRISASSPLPVSPTRRIEQMESHPVWTMHLTRTSLIWRLTSRLPPNKSGKCSARAASKIQRPELNIVSRSKDSIRRVRPELRSRCLELKPSLCH